MKNTWVKPPQGGFIVNALEKESEVSRWFSFGHNFTCKTIALIQLALGASIVEVAQ